MKEIIHAAGGSPEFVTNDTAHMMGGCRMGDNPQSSVTNSYGQTHDIPNLFICSASLFVTSGAGNPTDTVMALAARTADHIIAQMKRRAIS
jgi:choline dehydrogenase-like flavoprotein